MKHVQLLLLFLALITFQGRTQDTLGIAPEACDIEWHAEKVTGSHEGNVTLADGYIVVSDGAFVGGSFLVDMTSITCTDLKRPYRDKLIQHLRSEDFFDVEVHPFAALEITEIRAVENGAFNTEITGKLAIKDSTHLVTFPARVKVKDNKFAAYGEIAVDRTKYGIRWGSTSFMDNLGDRAIDDIFTLHVSIGAKR